MNDYFSGVANTSGIKMEGGRFYTLENFGPNGKFIFYSVRKHSGSVPIWGAISVISGQSLDGNGIISECSYNSEYQCQ